MPKINVHDMSPATVANARRLYEAYIANSDGLNYQGNPCPPWPELTEAVQSHWCAVVAAALVLDLTSVEQGPLVAVAPSAPEPTQPPATATAISVDDAIARVRTALVHQAELSGALDVGRVVSLSGALDVLHRSPRHLEPPTVPASPRLISIEVEDGKLIAAGTVYPYTRGDADRRAEVADYLDRISAAVREGGWDVLVAQPR